MAQKSNVVQISKEQPSRFSLVNNLDFGGTLNPGCSKVACETPGNCGKCPHYGENDGLFEDFNARQFAQPKISTVIR